MTMLVNPYATNKQLHISLLIEEESMQGNSPSLKDTGFQESKTDKVDMAENAANDPTTKVLNDAH